jgi:hypothetical protein
MATKKRYGLRLALPGAPNTPHTVPGVPGFYSPNAATPVGEEGELSFETAREVAKEEANYLELVTLTPKEAEAAVELAAETLEAARKGIAEARADGPEGAEVQRIKDEQAAAKAKE